MSDVVSKLTGGVNRVGENVLRPQEAYFLKFWPHVSYLTNLQQKLLLFMVSVGARKVSDWVCRVSDGV